MICVVLCVVQFREQVGNVAQGDWFTTDYKSNAIFSLKAKEVMMMAHSDGSYMGHAAYDVVSEKQQATLHSMLAAGSNHQWTSSAKSQAGSVGANGRARNAGDGFVDHGFAIYVNSNYSPHDSSNVHRLGPANWAGTSAGSTASINGHNFGGWGGRHERGGWGARYEGAAVCGYCNSQGCFGSNHAQYSSSNACSGCEYQTHDVDMAVFIR